MLPGYDFRESSSISKRQAIAILLANALISVMVSVVVFRVMEKLGGGGERGQPRPTAVVATLAGPPLPTLLAESGKGETTTSHQVQPGDTLFSLALKYNTSVEAIMKVNNLSDPNLLQVGQRLLIPSSLSLLPTPLPEMTPSATPSPRETASPTPKPGTGGKRMVEIAALVLAEGGGKAQVAILSNPGPPVSLKGWTLSDREGNTYLFPPIAFPTNTSLSVHTAPGKDTTSDLYWGREEVIWQKGADQAILRDEQGRIVATYDVK